VSLRSTCWSGESNQKEASVRKKAVEVVLTIGAPALHILERAIQDKDPGVRMLATSVAKQLGAGHIVAFALQDEEPEIRRFAQDRSLRLGILG
jgi:HEAT repeat protein